MLKFGIWATMFLATTLFSYNAMSVTCVGGCNQTIQLSINNTLTTATNVAGQVISSSPVNTNVYQYKQGATGPVWQTLKYTGPVVQTINNWNYAVINDYLQFALRFQDISCNKTYYPPTSFATLNVTPYCDNAIVSAGTQYFQLPKSFQVQLLVTRPLIGGVYPLNNQPVASYYLAASQGGADALIANVVVTGALTVPQTCTIMSGTTFLIDLGQIPQKNFVSGGAGNRPTGYINRPLTVKVACTGGIAQDASLTVRVQGTAATSYPNALATDNSGVGVVITKQDGVTPLVPNDQSSTIPLELSSGEGSVVIQAYPISLTGKAPDVGLFTSLSTLRFDFD